MMAVNGCMRYCRIASFNPDTAPVSAYMPSFGKAAPSLKVMPIVAPVHGEGEIEAAIIALGRAPGEAALSSCRVLTTAHRAPIILAAARNNVPAVYPQSFFARGGGLFSYGPDRVDLFRRAASSAFQLEVARASVSRDLSFWKRRWSPPTSPLGRFVGLLTRVLGRQP